jgi:hypothetical protein
MPLKWGVSECRRRRVDRDWGVWSAMALLLIIFAAAGFVNEQDRKSHLKPVASVTGSCAKVESVPNRSAEQNVEK